MLLYLAQLDFGCFVCRVVHKPRLKRSYVSMHIYTTYTHTHTHICFMLCVPLSPKHRAANIEIRAQQATTQMQTSVCFALL